MIGQLRHLLTIDHTRHHSLINMQFNVFVVLLAYIFKTKKVAVSFKKLNYFS